MPRNFLYDNYDGEQVGDPRLEVRSGKSPERWSHDLYDEAEQDKPVDTALLFPPRRGRPRFRARNGNAKGNTPSDSASLASSGSSGAATERDSHRDGDADQDGEKEKDGRIDREEADGKDKEDREEQQANEYDQGTDRAEADPVVDD